VQWIICNFVIDHNVRFLKLHNQNYCIMCHSRLVENITSGPVVAFLLVGENAIERLQCLIGDPDSGVARLKDPSTLRAIYGKDRIINAFHVSETPGCVEKVRQSKFYAAFETKFDQCNQICRMLRCSLPTVGSYFLLWLQGQL